MNRIIKQSTLVLLSTFAVYSTQAQNSIPFPVPSPQATLIQNFATSKIEINYSRPSMRGRKVFGDVVAYNQFWRTGANAATSISFGEDVKVNGIDVKAGKYGLITFPAENEWIVVLTKDFPTWEGAYKQENDVARFKVQPIKLNYSVETFTIDVTNIRENTCVIMLSWENTGIAFNVTSDYDERIMKQIEATMSRDARPFYQAANYYYENGKDLKVALEWINKAVEMNPKAYWIALLKAKIQKDLKDYNGALATSQLSYNLAKEQSNETYMKNNELLMAEIKAMPDYKPEPKGKRK
jgi:hypothetical protein